MFNFLKYIYDGFYSIGEGMASIDLFPPDLPPPMSDEEAAYQDYLAMRGDWEVVEEGLRKAMGDYERKHYE